jgi:hypothetical protein
MARNKQVDIWTNSTLVAALGNTVSGWIDIGKQTPSLDVLRTNTAGTYAFEVDWSRDGGASTLTTDTITTTAGTWTHITSKARWCRLRVRNTHSTNAFTAHSTQVAKDTGPGAR